MKLQKLLSYVRRAVEDYNMIEQGDKTVSYTHLTLPTTTDV